MRKVAPRHVWIATEYNGLSKELIHRLKFERAKSASGIIASILDDFLPLLPDDTIVTYIPTTSSRIRLRGYDQSRLIAKQFAYQRSLVFEDLILRAITTRQVGSSRKTRFDQMVNAFEVKNPNTVQDQTVLLIDDVLTTGATIESASRILADSGAKRVEVAVFAH
jgi:ComF family protein